MNKQKLISYINMLYHNWGVCDEQLQNTINNAEKLQDELKKVNDYYFKLEKAIECIFGVSADEVLKEYEEKYDGNNVE